MALRPYQQEAIDSVLKARERKVKRQLLSLAGGTGKCHAPGTPIMLSTGHIKNVEDICVGDSLMGPDSLPRKVLSLSHGFDEMYEVIPTKGDSYTVTHDHVLAIRIPPKYKGEPVRFQNITVDEYLTKTKFYKYMSQTYRVGCDWARKSIPIDPYYFGLWLGDGNATDCNITNPDHEVIEYLQDFAERIGLQYVLRKSQTTSSCPLHAITSGIGAAPNHLLNSLRSLGVISNKHIPHEYKRNSRVVRLQLLAGLLDSDGFYGSGIFEISSVFPALARDILFLARSLGFAAYESVGPKSSQYGTVGIYHRITISGHLDEIPTKIARKQATPRKQKKNVLCSGIKVESRGVGEYYGFEIDGDHLYLMGDFTVTHNSLIFGNIPKYSDRRTMLIVHTKELVNQAAGHLMKWNPGLTVGVEMADQITTDEQIVVASIATIGRALSGRLSKFDRREFGFIQVDECHRSLSDGYMNVFEHFGLFEEDYWDGPTLLGLTATPFRGDGAAMGVVYEEIVYTYSMQDAIRDGWLVDVKGIRVRTGTDISKVGSQNGDFKQDELAETVNNPERNRLIVNTWVKQASKRRTIGFTVDIQHAKDLATEFQLQGVAAVAIWGSDPDRAEKIRMHRSGQLQILLCSQLLVEGYDDPLISCVIMAKPTKSLVFFIQGTVRGDRLDPLVDNLVTARLEGRLPPGAKTDMLLIDVCDTTSKHSLVTLPSLFGLSPKLDLKGTSVMAAVKAIEEAQAQNPNLDLTGLEDITKLKAYTEEVNLFSVTFCPEIMEASELQWHRRGTENYCLLLPAREQIVVKGDLLGQYSVHGVVEAKPVAGTGFKDLQSAIEYAEKRVTETNKRLLTLLRRESKWHAEPITEGQIKMLKMLKVPLNNVAWKSKGAAAKLITMKLGERKR